MKKFTRFIIVMLILCSIMIELTTVQKTAYAKVQSGNIENINNDEYIEDDNNFEYDDLEISDEEIELTIGEQAEISIMTVEDQLPVRTSWYSCDSSIACINQDGLITAKRIGTVIITGVVSGYAYECIVYVKRTPPNYKVMVNRAKKYNCKYIKFKHVDVGYESRLLGEKYIGARDYSKTRNYCVITEGQPYINIKKNGKSVDISLNLGGKYRHFSASSYYPNYTKIKLYTNNRKITYNITSKSKLHKQYHSILQWKSRISSNDRQSIDKLNKLIKIFEHKNITLEASNNSGKNWVRSKLPESLRKHWLKIFKTYKKLLQMYD